MADSHRSGTSAGARIRLKCHFDNEIRVVIIAPDQNFSQLKKRLLLDYGFEVSLKYQDHDGDLITLSSQNDLNELILSGLETFSVIVSEALLPDLRTRSGAKNSSSTSRREWSKNHFPESTQVQSGLRYDRFPIIEQSYQHEHFARNIRWKQGEILGQGAFGVVYLGLNIESGELMAVKKMSLEEVSQKELSSLENEISLLRNLRHQNIVRYIGTEVTPESLSIFLEYVPGGSLKALIDKFGALEESVVRSYTRQLLLGLEYLHRNGIAHRDIKGANCLVGNIGVVKLTDFGASKQWRSTAGSNNGTASIHRSGDIKGTPAWMAPEVIRDQDREISWKRADVWSLGCTTIEMTTGKPPWSQFANHVTVLYHLACQETLPQYPNDPSMELLTFLNVCLQRNFVLRPDITSLLLHPFVANLSSSGGYGSNHQQFQQRPTTVSTTPFDGQWDGASYELHSRSEIHHGHGGHNNGNRGDTRGGGRRQKNTMTLTPRSGVTSVSGVISSSRNMEIHRDSISLTEQQQQLHRSDLRSRQIYPNLNDVDNDESKLRDPEVTTLSLDLGVNLDLQAQVHGMQIGGDDQSIDDRASAITDEDLDNDIETPRVNIHTLRLDRLVLQNNDYTAATSTTYTHTFHANDSTDILLSSRGGNTVAEQSNTTESVLSRSCSASTLMSQDSQELLAKEISNQHISSNSTTNNNGNNNNNEENNLIEESFDALELERSLNESIAISTITIPSEEIDTRRSDLEVDEEEEVGERHHLIHIRSGSKNIKQQQQRQQSPQIYPLLPQCIDSSKQVDHSTRDGRRRRNSRLLQDKQNNNNNIKSTHSRRRKKSKEEEYDWDLDSTVAIASHDTATTTTTTNNNNNNNNNNRMVPYEVRQQKDVEVVPMKYPRPATNTNTGTTGTTNAKKLIPFEYASLPSPRKTYSCSNNTNEPSGTPHVTPRSSWRPPPVQQQLNDESTESILPREHRVRLLTEGVVMDIVADRHRYDDSRLADRNELSDYDDDIALSSSTTTTTTTTTTVRFDTGEVGIDYDNKQAKKNKQTRVRSSNVNRKPSKPGMENQQQLQQLLPRTGTANTGDRNSTANVKPFLTQNLHQMNATHTVDNDLDRERDGMGSRIYRGSNSNSNGLGRGVLNESYSTSSLDVSLSSSSLLLIQPIRQSTGISGAGGGGGGGVNNKTAAYPTHGRQLSDSPTPYRGNSALGGGGGGGGKISRGRVSLMAHESAGQTSFNPSSDLELLEVSGELIDLGITSSQLSRGGNNVYSNSPMYGGSSVTGNNSSIGYGGSISRSSSRKTGKGLMSSEQHPQLQVSDQRRALTSLEDDDNSRDRDRERVKIRDREGGLDFNVPMLIFDQHVAAITKLSAPKKAGTILISSSLDGTVRIWSSSSSHPRATLLSDINSFNAKTKNEDGKYDNKRGGLPIRGGLSGGGGGGGGAIFPIDSQESSLFSPYLKQAATNTTTATNTTSLSSLVRLTTSWVDEGCDTIWGGGSDGLLRLWTGQEGRPSRLLSGHDEGVTAMEGTDGSINSIQSSLLVATGSVDRTVRVWDGRGKRAQSFCFRGHSDSITSIVWGDSCRAVVSSSKDKTIKIWDLRTGRLRVSMEKHFGAVTALSVVPESSYSGSGRRSATGDAPAYVSAGRDSMLHIWSQNGDCVGTQAAHRGVVCSLSKLRTDFAYSPATLGSPVMLSGGSDGLVKLWDLRRMKVLSEISSGVTSKVIWLGQCVVTGGSSGAIKLWDYTSNGSDLPINNNNNNNNNNSGQSSGGNDNNSINKDWSRNCRDLGSHTQCCTDLVSNDNFLASGSKSGQIFLWSRGGGGGC